MQRNSVTRLTLVATPLYPGSCITKHFLFPPGAPRRNTIFSGQEFVEQLQISSGPRKVKEFKIWIKQIINGVVIDHIGIGSSVQAIWDQVWARDQGRHADAF